MSRPMLGGMTTDPIAGNARTFILIPGRICDILIGVWRPQIKTTVYII